MNLHCENKKKAKKKDINCPLCMEYMFLTHIYIALFVAIDVCKTKKGNESSPICITKRAKSKFVHLNFIKRVNFVLLTYKARGGEWCGLDGLGRGLRWAGLTKRGPGPDRELDGLGGLCWWS